MIRAKTKLIHRLKKIFPLLKNWILQRSGLNHLLTTLFNQGAVIYAWISKGPLLMHMIQKQHQALCLKAWYLMNWKRLVLIIMLVENNWRKVAIGEIVENTERVSNHKNMWWWFGFFEPYYSK